MNRNRITADIREERPLASRLERRIAVEREFERLGHSYRHGRLHRTFENRIARPALKLALQAAGIYERGKANALRPIVRELRLRFDNLPPALSGFRLLQISDLHIDGTDGLAEAIASLLATVDSDACVLTGDYRFEDYGPCDAVYPRMRTVIESIRARYGIYGILGNHDPAEAALELEDMGVRMLVNEGLEITPGHGPGLWLAGVDDPFDYRCDELPAALAHAPEDALKVLLAHAPELYEEAAGAEVDLYLSGHTHAGQIRFPLIGSIRNNADCPRAYAFGHWRHGRMQGYTTAGAGCSSLPVRYNCPPEVALIELRES